MGKFLVDVEATGPTPMTSVMTEAGFVELETGASVWLRVWKSVPREDHPVISRIVGPEEAYALRISTSVDKYAESPIVEYPDALSMLGTLHTWLDSFPGHTQMISDNPAFDFMWIACLFDGAGMENPFGHSARRIGDFAAGIDGRWAKSNDWKRLRKTPHTHDPVDDAVGNREALLVLLERGKQARDARI